MIKKVSPPGIFVAVIIVTGSFVFTASANHSWGFYHWARTANPLVLKLGDNLSSNWDAYLIGASKDWSVSSVLDTTVVPGSGGNPRLCRARLGRVEVCNSKYGNNGWLGIASIWVNGEHITQGTVKMNDTYFGTAQHNTPAWRNLVLCQEVGHTFGLDHQDEDFANTPLGTCMDYSSDPIPNQHPNTHDYDMLETIYAHIDGSTTVGQAPVAIGQGIDHNDPQSWGKRIHASANGRAELYMRDFGKGNKVFTHVFWAN